MAASAAVGVGHSFLLLLAGSRARAGDIDLPFTDRDRLDTSRLGPHDPAKPFYFALRAPAEDGSAKPYKFTVDKGTDFQVWLDKKVPPGSTSEADRSLAIKISATTDENVNDKILFGAVLHSSDDRMDIQSDDTRRYISFDFMLDPAYEAPSGWALHLQVWQCCGGHPPFAIHVTPSHDRSGPVEFAFTVTDDALEASQYGKPRVIHRMTIARGVWNTMTLMLEPHFDASPHPGRIAMWFNGKKEFAYEGFWGFRPGYSSNAKAELTSHLGVDIGTYRRRQRTTQVVYFDNIHWTRSYPTP